MVLFATVDGTVQKSLVASHAPDGRIGAAARSPWKEPVTGSDATRDFCKGYMSMYT